MELTFTNEINLLDLIGLVGWAIGLFVGANWLKHRYANRLGVRADSLEPSVYLERPTVRGIEQRSLRRNGKGVR